MRENFIQISRETGIPTKKVLDLLFSLRSGEPVENNDLLQRIGVSRNALSQAKKLLSSLLKPSSKNTQLKPETIGEIANLFESGYKPEETLWSIFESKNFEATVSLLEKYKDQRPSPNREYDQFTATIETTAKRACLLNFFEDIEGKRLLFLGDNDFTSVAVASFRKASEITVLDIDKRILDKIDSISKGEGLNINSDNYDAREILPGLYTGKFDVVFTDPPYTEEGMKLFLSRAVRALDLSNNAARIYICYGNSDRAKERFLPIYDAFTASGLMMRWVFDKFNRYQGAESIGSSSSLFILDVTPATESLILEKYDKPIYTNN